MEQKRRKAEYRSSIRSKLLIRNALVSLMQEKPFEKITVTDIVKRADINRGTFYAHYKDSRQVLDKIRADVSMEISKAFSLVTPDELLENPEPVLTAISSFVSKDKDYYRMLIMVAGVDEFLKELRKVAFDYASKAERVRNASDQTDARCRIDFIISGAAVLYHDAILGTSPIDVDAVPSFLSGIIRSVVAG